MERDERFLWRWHLLSYFSFLFGQQRYPRIITDFDEA
jgi:hypothetical protein